MKKFFTLILAVAAAVTVNAASYTIVFHGNDSTGVDSPAINGTYSGQAGPDFMTGKGVIESGAEYLDSAQVNKVYRADHQYGIKFSTSSVMGSIKLFLSEKGKVTATKVTIKGTAYVTDYKAGRYAKLALFGDTCDTLLNDTISANPCVCEWEFKEGKALETLDITTAKADPTSTKAFRCNIKSITVEYTEATAVEDVNANKQVAAVRYYNLAGQESANAFEGVNIVRTVYTDGTEATSKLLK